MPIILACLFSIYCKLNAKQEKHNSTNSKIIQHWHLSKTNPVMWRLTDNCNHMFDKQSYAWRHFINVNWIFIL